MARQAYVFALAAALLFAAEARATPPSAQATPNVRLSITALAPDASWRMRVENLGEVPLRLTADARLLSFDIVPPTVDGAKAATTRHPNAPRTLHCSLPSDMRPDNDVDRALVIPPKRAYAEMFDPRLYCFGAAEAKARVAGATMVAHLGFHPGGATAPFEVSGIEGVVPTIAPQKELVSAPFAVPDDPHPAGPSGGESAEDGFPTKLTIDVPSQAEGATLFDLVIPVTVANRGRRPVTLMLRHETIGFDIIGPQGTTRCDWPAMPPAPMREIFTVLAPGARHTVPVLLSSVCTGTFYDQPGLLIVRPRLDTRRAGGEAVGLRTFDGEVLGASSAVVRIHRGRTQPTWSRPRLETQ